MASANKQTVMEKGGETIKEEDARSGDKADKVKKCWSMCAPSGTQATMFDCFSNRTSE